MLWKVCVVAVPVMPWAAVMLLNETVPVPGRNVPPLLVQLPPMSMLLDAASKVVPEAIVKEPAMVAGPRRVFVPAPERFK